MNEKNKKLLLKNSNKYKINSKSAVERYKQKKKREYFFITLIFCILITLFWFINSQYVKIKYININGVNEINKQEILDKEYFNSNIKIWDFDVNEVKNKLLNEYNIIANINIEKKWFRTVNITLEEKKIVAKEKDEEGNYLPILESGEFYKGKIINQKNLPILSGYKDNDKKLGVIKNLLKLKEEVLFLISEIVDVENSDFSYVYMKDGQKVKVYTNNFSDKLNYYIEIEKHIQNKKDTTLNLTNGAYLENKKSMEYRNKKIDNILLKAEDNSSKDDKNKNNNPKDKIDEKTKNSSKDKTN